MRIVALSDLHGFLPDIHERLHEIGVVLAQLRKEIDLVAGNADLRDVVQTVTRCGRICFTGRKINLSHVFAARTSASRRSTSASGS
jgi:predicted phosphodiesterase